MKYEADSSNFEEIMDQISTILGAMILTQNVPMEVVMATVLEMFMTHYILVIASENGENTNDSDVIMKIANDVDEKTIELNDYLTMVTSNNKSPFERLVAARLLMSTFTRRMQKESNELLDTKKVPKYDPLLDGPGSGTISLEDLLKGIDDDD